MNHFIEGAIKDSVFLELSSELKLSGKFGAHASFFGKIRPDEDAGKKVKGIEYSAYNEMANAKFTSLITELKNNYPVEFVQVYHSEGFVAVGESSLLVYIAAGHRKAVFNALEWLVEKIKFDVPIWKKEIFEDGSYRWKEDKRKPSS